MAAMGSEIKEYLDVRLDEVKLRTAKGLSVSLSRVLALLLIVIVGGVLILAVAAAGVLLLGELIGSYAGAAGIVAGVLLILFLVLLLLRRRLFRDTFVSAFTASFFPGEEAEAPSSMKQLDRRLEKTERRIAIHEDRISSAFAFRNVALNIIGMIRKAFEKDETPEESA